jgi:hypothetical protein
MFTDLIRNSQLCGFNNSSIGKICVAKCEKENGQTIIIQGIGIATNTCVVFNIIVKKIKLKHPNLTSQILLEYTSKSGRTYLQFLLKNTDFLCLFKNSIGFK